MVYPNVSRSIQLYLTVYVCIWLSSGSNCIQMYPQISLCIEVFPEDEMYPDVSRCIQMYPDVFFCHLRMFTCIQMYLVILGGSHVFRCIHKYPYASRCFQRMKCIQMYFLSSADVHMYPNVSGHLGRFTCIQVYPVVFRCIGTFFLSKNKTKKTGTCLKNLEFLFSSEKVSKYQENLGLV